MGWMQPLLTCVMAVGLCVPAWAARGCCCRQRANAVSPSCCSKTAAKPAVPKCCATRRMQPVTTATPVCQCHKDLPPVAVRTAASAKLMASDGMPISGNLFSLAPSLAAVSPSEGAGNLPPPRGRPIVVLLCRSLT